MSKINYEVFMKIRQGLPNGTLPSLGGDEQNVLNRFKKFHGLIKSRHGGICRPKPEPSFLSSCYRSTQTFISNHPIACAIAAIGTVGLLFYWAWNRYQNGQNRPEGT